MIVDFNIFHNFRLLIDKLPKMSYQNRTDVLLLYSLYIGSFEVSIISDWKLPENKKRIEGYLGKVTFNEMAAIEKTLAVSLAMDSRYKSYSSTHKEKEGANINV